MQKTRLLLFILNVFTGIITAGNQPEGISLTRVSDGYIVSFTLPQFQQEIIKAEEEEFISLLVPGYGTTSEPGLPALPLISFNLAVPLSFDKGEYEVIASTENNVTLNSRIYPFQEPWPKNKPISDRPFTINRGYYNSDGEVNPFVKISESFILGGVKGFRVIIQPFSYNPLQNTLTYISEGSFRIKVPAGEVDSKRSSYYNRFLSDLFVNYNLTTGTRGMHYLIITAPEYEAGLAPFTAHKTSMGFTVDVFNTGVTGATAAAIKAFILQRYNNPLTKPDFILLVGDVDKIPAWTGTGEGTPKTDLNYSCLEGTDYYADVFLGRFSVTSAAELQNAITKTVYMENYLATFVKRNIFMASTDNYSVSEGTHNYVISTYFDPHEYTNLKLYTHTYGATTAQLIAALNNNQLFAVYSGHGATTYWADGPVLYQSDIRALTNTVYPYVYSFACITGDYSYAECFGETWLRTNHGGASFYGSSVNSYWEQDDILERVVFKAMFDDDITKMTPMFNKGKIYFVNHYGSVTSTVLRYLEMYNLMGDPSLETVRHIPPDSTAPEPVTNLAINNPTSNSLTLNWTAPYDSTFGGITMYDIRYSTSPLNEGNFSQADARFLTGQSDSAGTPKSFVLDSLDFGTTYYTAVKAKDMWGNTSAISNITSFTTWSAPSISVSPDSITLVMYPDSNKTESVYITNTSVNPSTLDYTVQLMNNTYPGRVKTKIVPVHDNTNQVSSGEKGKPEKSGMSIKGHGGPDAFGYEWKDSNEPGGPVYVWNSIAGTGTQITNWIPTGSVSALDDGYAGPFPLGFNFKFYGEYKTQVYVHTNGMIVFVPVTGGWVTNYNIPNTSEPNGYIAPFWDDLDGRTQGTVHYKAETDKFIVQYTGWQKYGVSSSSLTFQVVINRNGRITYYYNTLTGDVNSCTVGIENPAGTTGLPVTYNAAYLSNNKAVQFAAEPEWILLNNASGTLTSGNTAEFQLQVTTEGLELGNYSMDVQIESNCPINPVVIVPVHLLVTNDVPVELVSFTGENKSGEVILRWQTKTEANNDAFRIERKSSSEKTWKEVGSVKGNGTTTEARDYSYKDKPADPGNYKYRLVQVDFNGARALSSEIEVDVNGPDKFELSQNYPNPFNPSTLIKYSLPVQSNVKLVIMNILGEVVDVLADGMQGSGYYECTWNASKYSSGIYICSLDAVSVTGSDNYRSLKKMILIK